MAGLVDAVVGSTKPLDVSRKPAPFFIASTRTPEPASGLEVDRESSAPCATLPAGRAGALASVNTRVSQPLLSTVPLSEPLFQMSMPRKCERLGLGMPTPSTIANSLASKRVLAQVITGLRPRSMPLLLPTAWVPEVILRVERAVW